MSRWSENGSSASASRSLSTSCSLPASTSLGALQGVFAHHLDSVIGLWKIWQQDAQPTALLDGGSAQLRLKAVEVRPTHQAAQKHTTPG